MKIKIVCQICSNEFEVKPYRAKTAKTCSNECRQELFRQTMIGEKSPNWKGGISERDSQARTWAYNVISRDKKCIECGSIEKLHAHHIKSYSEYPELRYDLDNGITLCSLHHADRHPELASDFIMHKSSREFMICKQCNTEFLRKKKKQIYCSVACRSASRVKEYLSKRCEICNKEYSIPKHRESRNRTCSNKCSGELGRNIKYAQG